MTLASIRKGGCVRICRLPEGDIRSQCIRIGLMEGAILACLERLPGGTIIVQHLRQEVALSADLAASIVVEACGGGGTCDRNQSGGNGNGHGHRRNRWGW